MSTPREFLERFWQEKTAAWAAARPQLSAVYSKYFGEPLSQQTERFMPIATVRADVEDVKQADGTASAVIRDHFPSGDMRTRYRLAAADESWRIIGIDRECYICRGTGQSGVLRCQECDGDGWLNTTIVKPHHAPGVD